MRLGINVPSDLLKRVKEIRPEVNVSQVCREALEQRIALGERAIARVMEDDVDREVVELAQSVRNLLIEPDWVNYALDDAWDWLSGVDKEEWEEFLELWDDLVDFGQSPPMRGTMSLFERMREYEDWFMAQDRVGNYSATWSKAVHEYERAWIGYVSEVRRKLDCRYNGSFLAEGGVV